MDSSTNLAIYFPHLAPHLPRTSQNAQARTCPNSPQPRRARTRCSRCWETSPWHVDVPSHQLEAKWIVIIQTYWVMYNPLQL